MIKVSNLTKIFTYYKNLSNSNSIWKYLIGRETINLTAVNQISFEIAPGEIIGFLGPNGAGKTTTLKMLSGILLPTSGSTEILGFCPWERANAYKKQISMVMGQKSQLWIDLPALDTFYLNKAIYEISDHQFTENLNLLSKILQIDEIVNIPVRKLSLGQKMKCELVAALLHNPQILFLDEPTIGLDINSQIAIRQFLKKYNQIKKATIILTSHYMEDIKELCERIIIINKGQKIYDDHIQNLLDKYTWEKRLEIMIEEEKEDLNLRKYGNLIYSTRNKYIFLEKKEKIPDIIKNIFTKYKVIDIMIKEKDIGEIIAQIFENNYETDKLKNHEKISHINQNI